MTRFRSWGELPAEPQPAVSQAWAGDALPDISASMLPFGNGRSYGDSCLNSDGVVVDTSALDHILSFDAYKGVITCEAGVSFSDILSVIVPKGWFLPVTPGTRFITVGGAVANDVHGKNHHIAGCFGRYVESFELLKSDGSRIICSISENSALYAATIGGLGLTGLILWVKFTLIKIESTSLDVSTLAFDSLDGFIELSESTRSTHDYTVAWLDCLSAKNGRQRGLFYAANHSKAMLDNSNFASQQPTKGSADWALSSFQLKEPTISIPFPLPGIVLNQLSVRVFNELYYHRHAPKNQALDVIERQSIAQYFYPLDGIGKWNRLYGKCGFYQYQFVLPLEQRSVMSDILQMISSAGNASFLAVLKLFGDIESKGLVSFPRPGLCLALDFTDSGNSTLELFKQIDRKIVEAGGAVYPAKDKRMTREAFELYFPASDEFKRHIDPMFNSNFWSRVSG